MTRAYQAEYAWLRRQPRAIQALYAKAVKHYALPLGFAALVRSLTR